MKRAGRIGISFLVIASVAAVAATVSHEAPAQAASLSRGNLTMASANSARTDSAPGFPANTFAAHAVSSSDDGLVVAFISTTPAEQIVNDPIQVNNPLEPAFGVTDTNGVADVFVWDARIPPPIGPVTTLVSWNAARNGAGGGEADPAS